MNDKKKRIRKLSFSTVQIIALGFFGVILAGAVLLWLPFSNRQPIAFADALFTAVSAVCVTGLVTIVPATQFSPVGKGILLVLIQIGGLGIIACTVAFFLLMHRRITMKERVLIQQGSGLDTPGGIVQYIIHVLKGTFIVEGIGAVCYLFYFVPRYGVAKGAAYSVFHSVSAFCNAGIDILGADSFQGMVTSPIVNLTTMALIVLGGLGFRVWYDILGNTKRVLKEGQSRKRLLSRLQLQSKIVLSMTVFLIAFGTVGYFLLEHDNPDTFGNLSLGQKWQAAAFQSVTTRTAGFATVSQAELTRTSKLLGCVLMFIGGSSGGTAGGVKTTTIALLILTCAAVLRGKRDTECFGRKIDITLVRSAVTITQLTLLFWLCGTVVIVMLEPDVDILSIMYETFSAVATVGLTADLTPQLCRASQAVLMILMYAGRIGPVTMAMVFAGKSRLSTQLRELPEKRIMIG
jgi:trk system potassium uptake protein TrkH